MYAPMDRVDFYVRDDGRRQDDFYAPKDRGRSPESRENYRGSLTWHEGEFPFKKDLTLSDNVPIPLIMVKNPTDPSRGWGSTFIVTDRSGPTRVMGLTNPQKGIHLEGCIRPGGYAAFADHRVGNDLLEHTIRALNLRGGTDGYPIAMKVGILTDATFFFTAQAQDNETLFTLGPQDLIIDLPIRLPGLEDNGCAAVYSSLRKWFRFVPVVGDTAYFQEPIEEANEMWVGNIFVCDNKAVKVTVVVDGQPEGQKPFVELHNPTQGEIAATVRSPAHTPIFGGTASRVTTPAGHSIRLRFDGTLAAE